MLSVIMQSVIMLCHYAECHYAECHYDECHQAECHYAVCRGTTQNAFYKCKFFFRRNIDFICIREKFKVIYS